MNAHVQTAWPSPVLKLSARTERFLSAAKARWEDPTPRYSLKWRRLTESFFGKRADRTLAVRMALSLADALAEEWVDVQDGGLLVGKLHGCFTQIGPEWLPYEMTAIAREKARRDMPELLALAGVDREDAAESWVTTFNCCGGHIGWHWEWVVAGGVESLFARIEAARPNLDEAGKEFSDCVRICLEAFLTWADRHVTALRELARRSVSAEERQAIERKIEICSRVPRYGARNFREATQAFYLSYLAVVWELPYGGNGPGRLDYHLWPYLERDLREGTETLESARELVDELFIRFHERLFPCGDAWVETIVVGGTAPDGGAVFNPLTQIIVESIAALKITHPAVYIRLPADPPDDLVNLAAWYLKNGENRAQILNDPTIIRAMVAGGVTEADARMYMCGGCMEISPQGMNGDLLFTGFFNAAKVLELVLNGGICMLTGRNLIPALNGKTLAEYRSFEELYGALESELRRTLTLTFRHMDNTAEAAAKIRPGFLASSMIEDCLARGRGINAGGARYEDYGSAPLGLPNMVDSLNALRTAVFDEGFISGAEALALSRSNFVGAEATRRRLLALPKYGEGNPEADALARRLCATVCDIYASYSNRLGGKIKPMIMAFIMAPIAGRALAATPDGRKAGTPVAQGVTPQSMAARDGLSAAMRSAADVELWRFSGGVSHMWDLDAADATIDNLKRLLQAFFHLGGQMYQGNVTDVEILRAAMKNPEAYSGLIVRIGGFSGRFVAQSPDIQAEIVSRHRYAS